MDVELVKLIVAFGLVLLSSGLAYGLGRRHQSRNVWRAGYRQAMQDLGTGRHGLKEIGQ